MSSMLVWLCRVTLSDERKTETDRQTKGKGKERREENRVEKKKSALLSAGNSLDF